MREWAAGGSQISIKNYMRSVGMGTLKEGEIAGCYAGGTSRTFTFKVPSMRSRRNVVFSG